MTHQGFIGSLSTSALLVGSAVAILLVVSAIVAFEGWPGPSADASSDAFLLEVGGGAAAASPPELVLEPAPPATGDGGGSPESSTSADAASAPTAPLPVPAGSSGAVPPPADGLALTDGAPAPGGGGVSEGGGSGLPDLGDIGGGSLGGPIDDATEALEGGADALSPVTGPVDKLLRRSTEPLADTIGGN